ncbi:pyridoxamine 5'-phosphate oxidase [Catellatospora methionotrophica]|uniref:Pyridoxamine 5'-phosphate oxidase n=1 Tax=Catellatospora methionotrophica TaxID=121620 RepID=A0A8J3LE73_9ACTN|nr:pyridoxamine 5'-phosphate oxidase family protein [Catellatospora methionotrophica]GIG16820.1 pyridoxamine 5'-phosphate oxidase [Catellatospora methionotrophica]
MSESYASIAFTRHVRQAQERYGSRAAAQRLGDSVPGGGEPRDPLTAFEADFIELRDGFYLASTSDTGWPYVQFRGGPPGFVKVLDEHTLGWADFRGNRQYISVGNIAGDDRVSVFFMDYPRQLRLKVFGHASVVDVRDDPSLAQALTVEGYRAKVERAVTVTVVAFDWNCQQHITPRYSAEELRAVIGPMQEELERLRAQVRGGAAEA